MNSATEPPFQHGTNVPAQNMTTTGQWSTGLYDCGKDWSSCCLTCWCPCISFGRITEVVNKGDKSCGKSGCFYGVLCVLVGSGYIYSHRTKIREQYKLPEQPCSDCVVHCCCDFCALCQEYRELKYRGLEPSLGWQGNLARQNQGIVMPPIGPGEMKR